MPEGPYRPLDAQVLPRFAGVRTLMRLPVVRDLAGVDAAAVGIPFDSATSFRAGARFGPEAIRSASALLRPFHPGFGLDLFEALSVVDYGDLPTAPGDTQETYRRVEEALAAVVEAGVFPLVLGGDHSITLTGAGDYVTMRTELDCFVVVSSCPQDLVAINEGEPTPIALELLSARFGDSPVCRLRYSFPVGVERLSRDWDELAEDDALFVVLAEPGRQGGRWDLEEFYATGEHEIAQFLARAERVKRPAERGRALDFGSGVGRLTRALSAHFDECVGIDVSAAMVRRARELNADHPTCSFVPNVSPDLSQFESGTFDLVYSSKVLQHLPSRKLACAYVEEFLRVAKADGLVAFQLWTRLPIRNRLQPRRRLYAALRALRVPRTLLLRFGLSARGRGLAVPESQIRRTIERRGGKVLLTEPDGEWGLWYFAAP